MSWLTRVIEREPLRAPRPRMSIELDRSMPAWSLRGLAAATIILVATPVLGSWVVPLLVAALVMFLPHQGTVTGLALLAGFWLVAEPPDLLLCATLTFLLHVVLTTVRLTGPVGVTGRIEMRLLMRAAVTFFVIQVLAQAMVALAFTAMASMPPLPWLGVLVTAAIGVGIVAAVRWVARRTQ
jgi:hypothetical protein